MKQLIKLTPVVYLVCGAGVAFAQNAERMDDCSSYPYQAGDSELTFEDGGKFRIVATSATSVDFDDATELMSARREAELRAKGMLAEFINQRLSTEDSINQEVSKSRSLNKLADETTEVQARRDETKQQISSIAARADAVLRGAISLGTCYTKGSEVRVTVGIKSESVANATQLGETMGVNAAQAYGTGAVAAPGAGGSAGAAPAVPPKPPAGPKDGETQSYKGGDKIKDF